MHVHNAARCYLSAQSRWQIGGDTIVFCCVILFADYSCFDLFIELRRRRRRCLVRFVNISICFVVTMLLFLRFLGIYKRRYVEEGVVSTTFDYVMMVAITWSWKRKTKSSAMCLGRANFNTSLSECVDFRPNVNSTNGRAKFARRESLAENE